MDNPEHGTNDPFTTSEGIDAGLTAKQLRGKAFDRSVWGVRARRAEPALERREEIIRRAAFYLARLPDDTCLSHSTAAIIHGIPIPWWLERRDDLHFTFPAPRRAPHAKGIRGHSLTLESYQVVPVEGLRVTSVERTWCDLASMLPVEHLVAAGDFLIHWRNPKTDALALLETVQRFPGLRGVKRMRKALPRLNGRSESPPESVVRFFLVEAGLPEPEVNYEIVMTDDGPGVRADLLFRRYNVLVEYQGDYHRTKEQWRKDMTRRSRIEAEGGFVIEINADDLRDPVELVARIRKVLEARSWRQ